MSSEITSANRHMTTVASSQAGSTAKRVHPAHSDSFICDVLQEIWQTNDRRVVTGLLAENLKRARDKREPKNVAFVQYILAALYQHWNKLERAEYHLREGFSEATVGKWVASRYKKQFNITRCVRRLKSAMSTFVEHQQFPYTSWRRTNVRDSTLQQYLLDVDEEDNTGPFVLVHSPVVILAHECAVFLLQHRAGEALHVGTLALEMIRRSTIKEQKHNDSIEERMTLDHVASAFVTTCLFLNCSIAYIRLNLFSCALEALKGAEYLASLLPDHVSDGSSVLTNLEEKSQEIVDQLDHKHKHHSSTSSSSLPGFNKESYSDAMKLYQTSLKPRKSNGTTSRKLKTSRIQDMNAISNIRPLQFWFTSVRFLVDDETWFTLVRIPAVSQTYSGGHSVSDVLQDARKAATSSKKHQHGEHLDGVSSWASMNALGLHESGDGSLPHNLHRNLPMGITAELSQAVSSDNYIPPRKQHPGRKVRRRRKSGTRQSYGHQKKPTKGNGLLGRQLSSSIDSTDQYSRATEKMMSTSMDETAFNGKDSPSSGPSSVSSSRAHSPTEDNTAPSAGRSIDSLAETELIEEYGEELVEVISEFQNLYRSKRQHYPIFGFQSLQYILRMLPQGVLCQYEDYEAGIVYKATAHHRIIPIRRVGTEPMYSIRSYLDAVSVEENEMNQRCIPIVSPRGPFPCIRNSAPLTMVTTMAAMRRYRILFYGKQRQVFHEVATKLQSWYRSLKRKSRAKVRSEDKFQQLNDDNLPQGEFFRGAKELDQGQILQLVFSVSHKISVESSRTGTSTGSMNGCLLPCFAVEFIGLAETSYEVTNLSLKHLREGRFPIEGVDTCPETVAAISHGEFLESTKPVSFASVLQEASEKYYVLAERALEESNDSPSQPSTSPESHGVVASRKKIEAMNNDGLPNGDEADSSAADSDVDEEGSSTPTMSAHDENTDVRHSTIDTNQLPEVETRNSPTKTGHLNGHNGNCATAADGQESSSGEAKEASKRDHNSDRSPFSGMVSPERDSTNISPEKYGNMSNSEDAEMSALSSSGQSAI
eukprot:gb/GECG01001584.1/.p1 GENE.gb/GECG01001584.1/~~gb/GECG01001584.1/.p1  ORF type:complete len:1046 (+),score=135.69 gb/GECG01001584.1/:1-3138(+)